MDVGFSRFMVKFLSWRRNYFALCTIQRSKIIWTHKCFFTSYAWHGAGKLFPGIARSLSFIMRVCASSNVWAAYSPGLVFSWSRVEDSVWSASTSRERVMLSCDESSCLTVSWNWPCPSKAVWSFRRNCFLCFSPKSNKLRQQLFTAATTLFLLLWYTITVLRSNQEKRTPQNYLNQLIIRLLKPIVVPLLWLMGSIFLKGQFLIAFLERPAGPIFK